jgi:hypothetical protein
LKPATILATIRGMGRPEPIQLLPGSTSPLIISNDDDDDLVSVTGLLARTPCPYGSNCHCHPRRGCP